MNEIESQREFLLSQISDDYKSLNGFRPRFDMSCLTVDELQQFHNQIITDLHNTLTQEKQDERDHYLIIEQLMTSNSGWPISMFWPEL